MNDEEMARAIREAHEATDTRPLMPKTTQRMQSVSPHTHSFQVATSNLTSIRYCVTCGRSWVLKPILRNSKHIQQWEQILESD